MADWRQIQARIRKAKNSTDARTKLSELYQRTRDAMVSWELAAIEEKAEHTEEAIRWYTVSAERFRRADWKKKAEEALTRLGAPIPAAGDKSASKSAEAAHEDAIEANGNLDSETAKPRLAVGEIPEDEADDSEEADEASAEDSGEESSEAGANAEGAANGAADNGQGKKKRRRGRRGGRGRRRKGGAAPARSCRRRHSPRIVRRASRLRPDASTRQRCHRKHGRRVRVARRRRISGLNPAIDVRRHTLRNTITRGTRSRKKPRCDAALGTHRSRPRR